MRLRSRALALTVALGIAGLGLAGCATDSVTTSQANPDIGSFNYNSDQGDWLYDYGFGPYSGLGWWGDRAHFDHGFGGHSMGHHR